MNKHDLTRNYFMLNGKFARQGYDWWWHNFTGFNPETGEERTFFIEYFTCNPALADINGDTEPILGSWLKINQSDSKNHQEWMCDDGSMTWNISIEKNVAFNVGYGLENYSAPLKPLRYTGTPKA